jgi:hypothetical protein
MRAGAEFITNDPVLRLARRVGLLAPSAAESAPPPAPQQSRTKKSRARSSSPAAAYPTHVPTAGRPVAGAIPAPAMFAAAVSVAAAAAACNLSAAVLASAAALLPAVVAAGIGGALLLIAFNNITDYHTNFAMVEHVLAMDAMIPALGAKTHLLSYFVLKMIILPRQARDKHRGNSPQKESFSQATSRSSGAQSPAALSTTSPTLQSSRQKPRSVHCA